jgi:hypothetical protein
MLKSGKAVVSSRGFYAEAILPELNRTVEHKTRVHGI